MNSSETLTVENITDTRDEESSSSNSLVSLIISELECPVCYNPMLGDLHLPLLCANGHPCRSSCSARTGRTCPTCRSSNTRWTRCLPLERMGKTLVDMGLLLVEEDLDPEHGQEDPRGMRRSRSNRLERARRHLDMWGRMGRGQPGRYWRGRWDEIVKEEI